VIASYSISPSAPTGTSFNTSTGLLSGTPKSVQSATTYTITATNATSSASQTFSLTVTLAAPAFTLSSGSESKAQNTAITGYTISSTGGVIASYSISPSAPAGTSFNTSTGLLSGTPSSVQSATTYTITATNATSSASQTFSLTVTTPASCADGGVCALGNTGPGGGKVFYVAPTTFTCGANLELTCKYLEASPIAYDSETWAFSATSALACYTEGSTTGTSDCRYNSIYSGTSASQSSSRSAAYGMGRGLANTNQIYARLTTAGGSLASSYAAGIAYDYSTTVSGTTFTDWYLPSQDELSQMWTNRSSIGGLPNADYWTSTEADPNDFRHMFAGTFHTNSGSKSDWTRKVRPIRAFAPIP
jgi:LysM repeat protein